MTNQHSSRLDRTDAHPLPGGVGVQPPPNPDPPYGRVHTTAGGDALPDRPAGRVKPIFVDRTGRRRRVAVLAGLGLGAGLLVSLALLALGLVTGGSIPTPDWPDAGSGPGRDKAGVDRSGTGTPTSAAPTAGPAGAALDDPSRPPSPRPRSTPPPSPTLTARPGQGDLHRNSSPGKPTDSTDKPDRPSRSSTGAG